MFNVGDIVKSTRYNRWGYVPSLCRSPRMYTMVCWFDNGSVNLCGNNYIKKVS